MEKLSLSDLLHIKSILEERLKSIKAWVDAERGYDYEAYLKRELIYTNDENHKKLRQVNQQIKDIIDNI